MAYNITASLGKLTCTDYVDLAKCQDGFGRFSWSKNDSNYLDVKLKVFKKDDKGDFCLVQNLTMREADFNHFIRLRNQPVIAVETFAKEEKLSPVLMPTISKDMAEQLKLPHNVVDVVDRANKNLCDSAAVQCEQAGEFLCSSLNICKEEGGRDVSTSCLCEY